MALRAEYVKNNKCRATAPAKRKFRSKLDALMALSGSRPNGEKRAYLCPDCGYWHLTSRA